MQNGLGKGFRVTSWIWTTRGVLGDNSDALLNDAVCVEWAKACARSLRWSEEVLLLKEEMRRVRQYLGWRAQWWLDHHDKGIVEGARAYAYRQSAIQHALLYGRLNPHLTKVTNFHVDGAEEDKDKVDDVD
ncbi:uncharacterized protein F5891DRAFT_1196364 [Suillus fuscotomentosus]|uniref:Uncharacterized protein n=1 Tax=Suillus fuscotomentosus TaxID=1912939 RepID=A0AAD4DT77_9AGAM|nr:uncharacterized protein F5891DRAFT_1196364 [Suillus fuscotomentosus]KAG1893513.1 hypothetical protein F5891DRAFT_1196364 [Suillus fuscotomentosus]